MSRNTRDVGSTNDAPTPDRRLMGSLRDALAAAGRSSPPIMAASAPPASHQPIALPPPAPAETAANDRPPAPPSATEAALEARGARRAQAIDLELDDAPRTKVVRGTAATAPTDAVRTQLLRGRPNVKRTDFHQDPVVGWLVVVGGPGLGAFRPIYEGNNTVGRGRGQRIPIDFGDETISNEEQAYIRYDSVDRRFLLVPNLAKTNVVAVNDRKPTGAVELSAMDLITVGRTQLAFVPFCGADFDWAELSETRG